MVRLAMAVVAGLLSCAVVSAEQIGVGENQAGDDPAEKGQAIDAIKAASPGTVSKVLGDLLGDEAGWRLFDGLTVSVLTFQAADASNLALGVSYDLSKDVARQIRSEGPADQSGVSLTLAAQGNVAFDKDTNPKDFLNTDFSFHWFASHGGVVSVSDADADRLGVLEGAMAGYEDPDELANSPEQKEFFSIVRRGITTQTYADVSATAGFESNQDFSLTQYRYGAQTAFDIKAWNSNSLLAKLNVFDWPFALTRWLTYTDATWEPRGSSFPTVLAGLDYVLPQDRDPRALAGDDSGFARVRGEVAFRTLLADLGDLEAYFESNYRYYRELGASAEVKDADLEKQTYFVMAVTMSNGAFVSYSTGQLPFAVKADKVYEIGVRYEF